MTMAVLLMLMQACGSPPPLASPATHDDPAEPNPDPTNASEADSEPSTEAVSCYANDIQCCQPDGSLVRPGGCQPVYPDGAIPGLLRGDDGFCVQDPEPCRVRCLPHDARIATPHGDVPVRRLSVGDLVFTEGADGQRRVAPIVLVSAVQLSQPHSLVVLRLSDGRQVRASAGHPSAHGAELGTLESGSTLDGATIERVDRIEYQGSHTFDLLPDGPTGVYWADGVRLGSTLSP